MRYAITEQPADKEESSCLIIGIFEDKQLSDSAELLDAACHHKIKYHLDEGDIDGTLGQTLILHNVDNIIADRVLLIGCGQQQKLSIHTYKQLIQKATKVLVSTGATTASYYLPELTVNTCEPLWKLRQAIEVIEDTIYQFEQFKSKKANERKLTIVHLKRPEGTGHDESQHMLTFAKTISKGKKIARDLANTPANICTPTYINEQAKLLMKDHKQITHQVLEEKHMAKLGMGAFLSVSKGSAEPAKMIILTYLGAEDKKEQPYVLIGKGITFDSGGLSLKSAQHLDEMKYDMCGAASVLGTLEVIAKLQVPINLICVLACSENLPGERASKPGDIVETMSGKTVEILNTDAEGRLVLCDALTYVEQFSPKVVIDIATLTGAMVVSLGHEITGMMSNNDSLSQALLEAGKSSGDDIWHLPIPESYQASLDSHFADIANISTNGGAGSLTAACFLSRFCEQFPWAHLDIAGTGWKIGNQKGATGRPVSLLSQYLIDCSAKVEA